jgi:hypothetical protein
LSEGGAIYLPSPSEGPLRQGEIISGLVQARLDLDSVESGVPPLVNFVTHPFAVIVSQDCDLEQDYKARNSLDDIKADKILPSILFCEVNTAEDICRSGGVTGSSNRSQFSINKLERYQYLQKVGPLEDALHEGLPELGIDFKRYFTIPADEVYKRIATTAKRRCFMNSPYLEHLSSRFCYFQMRIALPEEHRSE